MKRFACLLSILAAVLVHGPCLALDINAVTGMHYTAWSSDDDDDGQQFYIPVQVAGSHGELSFHLVTAYADTQIDREGGVDDGVSNMTDTKAGVTYAVKNRLPVDLLMGLDLNLPTGETGIEDELAAAIRDPDLYPIAKLGEGFNLNPTLTVTKNWQNVHAGFGIGYAWRGEYDYSESIDTYDPGDIFNLVVEVDVQATPRCSARLYAERAWYGDNEQDGDAVSKNGDFTMIGLDFNHLQAQWDAKVSVSVVLRDKSEYADESGDLVTEERNSFGDEWNAQALVRYHLDAQNTISAVFDYLNIQENDYDDASPYYFGGREKYGLTLGYAHLFDHGWAVDGAVEGFKMEDDPNFYHPGEDRSYTGYSLTVMVCKSF